MSPLCSAGVSLILREALGYLINSAPVHQPAGRGRAGIPLGAASACMAPAGPRSSAAAAANVPGSNWPPQ